MAVQKSAASDVRQAEYSADGRARGEAGGKLAGREEPEIRLEWAASWKGRTETATVRTQVPYSGRQRAGAVE